MMQLRLAVGLLLLAVAAGQEQKSVADFTKPFKVVANLIVDKNFFLLREVTAEEKRTGVVDLEDPFGEKSRPTTEAPTTTTTTTTTPAPRRTFSAGLLPPPPPPGSAVFELPKSFFPPAREAKSSRGRFLSRGATTTTTEAPTTTEEEEVTTVAPARRRGSVRRKIVRVTAPRGNNRRRPVTPRVVPAAAVELPAAAVELPAATAPTTQPPRRSGGVVRRRRPVVKARVVGTVAPSAAPIDAPTAAPTTAPTAAPTAAPTIAAPVSRRRQPVTSAALPEPLRAARVDEQRAEAVAVIHRGQSSSRRVLPEGQDEENEIDQQRARLPGGSRSVIPDMRRSFFSCKDRPYGYYADVDSDCQVFHICTPMVHADGFTQNIKHSLFCNNGTRFDQRTLTCREEDLALPCAQSEDFFSTVKYFQKFNIFDQLRAEDERRRRRIIDRLETLEDVADLEAELDY